MENFSCHSHSVNKSSIISLYGELDAYTAETLEKEIQKLIDDNQFQLIINMQNLSYISSAGLGVFMGFVDIVRSHGGDIKFCCLSDKIFQVFDILGFPLLYEFYNTEREALDIFHEKEQ